jgi:hypothetical protein
VGTFGNNKQNNASEIQQGTSSNFQTFKQKQRRRAVLLAGIIVVTPLSVLLAGKIVVTPLSLEHGGCHVSVISYVS